MFEKLKWFIYHNILPKEIICCIYKWCRILTPNVRRTWTNISNLMGNSKLMNVPLFCLTETQLPSATVLRDASSTYEIVINDDQFDNIKACQ